MDSKVVNAEFKKQLKAVSTLVSFQPWRITKVGGNKDKIIPHIRYLMALHKFTVCYNLSPHTNPISFYYQHRCPKNSRQEKIR
jgi:hypothetical protein